ncbi:MAG: ABC transporter ATP-binding protein [Alicyclobacillus sp.]|nr:ABC transporter ATP-binding protein [Alicyclobacillus sp.]
MRDVVANIGEYRILDGVRLAVPEGSVTVMLGRNGAGKTTTLRTIMGFVPCLNGTVRLFGDSLAGLPPHRIARLGVGYVPEDANVFPNLTVAENLRLALPRAHGRAQAEEAVEQVLGLFPDLRQAYRRWAGHLSGGQRQMLAIASVLVSQPRVMLIDEPSKGLSPRFVDLLGEVIAQLRGRTTVLLVEQNLRLAAVAGERFTLLDEGRTVMEGPMEELLENTALQQRYLGVRVRERGN